MAMRRICKHLLASAAALTLAACGGGATESTNLIPSAPVTPTPAPTPTPTASLSSVGIFAPPAPDGQLAVVGLEAPGDNSATLTSSGFSVSYDALLGRYLIKVPSMPSGYFYRTGNDVDPSWWIGTLASLDRTAEHGNLQVLKPSNPELQLTYTTMAAYNGYAGTNVPFGWFAFGTATPAAAVPTTGTASYNALIRGASTQRFGLVVGTAALQFDFGAGKLSGHLDPILTDPTGLGFNDIPLGRYDFVNAVYSSGSTTFSGQLSQPAVSGTGSFNGAFTGPSGEELMARWSAPYQSAGSTEANQIFGVLVGTRH